jgi:hypothetical protein
MVTLAAGMNAILDAVVAALTAQQTAGGTLTDVLVIARGDRSIPSPDVPALYVLPGKMRPNSDSTSQIYWWDLPVSIRAMIESDLPDDGYQGATDLAARAMAVLIGSRLPLTYVKTGRASEFESGVPWLREGRFFRAIATVRIPFESRG